jgi:hypothetical protein
VSILGPPMPVEPLPRRSRVRRRFDDLVEYASDLRYARRYRREAVLGIDPELAPDVQRRRRQEAAASAWPAFVIPGAVPWALVLGRSDDTVVWVHHFAAYPTGLMSTSKCVSALARSDDTPSRPTLMHFRWTTSCWGCAMGCRCQPGRQPSNSTGGGCRGEDSRVHSTCNR